MIHKDIYELYMQKISRSLHQVYIAFIICKNTKILKLMQHYFFKDILRVENENA